jgi:phosphotransferase system HPr-like phosphotransfer protein
MGMARYAIIGQKGDWHVEHDGKVANTYETKEAAFEAAVAAASLAMREGHEIAITAPGANATGTAN